MGPLSARGIGPLLARGMEPLSARGMGPLLARGIGPVLARGMGPVLARGMGPLLAGGIGPVPLPMAGLPVTWGIGPEAAPGQGAGPRPDTGPPGTCGIGPVRARGSGPVLLSLGAPRYLGGPSYPGSYNGCRPSATSYGPGGGGSAAYAGAGLAVHPSVGAARRACGAERSRTVADVVARMMPSCANMEAARIGAEPELADSGTGGALRDSLERSELASIRTASPSATRATTNP